MYKALATAVVAIILIIAFFLLRTTDEVAERTNNQAVLEHQLENGMKILVRPDSRAPVVVSQVWYKVGSSYEHNGITGISHMLEHMMFKGTKTLKPGEFSEIIARHGGRENAFTGRDYTAYFQTIAKDQLELCLELEADRMRNVVFDIDEFIKERDVVAEERRLRTDDKPRGLSYEQFYATAFTNSPYHHPIIGWMNDIQAYTLQDTQDWYNKWYAPNNATLVVVGDVDPNAVFSLAQKYFGAIQRSDIPVTKPQTEVAQLGKRRVEVEVPAKVPHLLMGYKVPTLKTAKDQNDAYALEVLAGILDGGESARMSRNLVRGKQKASSAGVGYSLYDRMDTLFIFSATPVGKTSVTELEQALLLEIEDLKNNVIDASELERVKAQVVASDVYQRDSMFYQGMILGTLETVGLDWRVSNEYVERIQAVTAEQVQAVARKYFIPKHMTIAELVPQTMENS